MIPVTKPFLPPKELLDVYISDIWSRGWLTNNGPLVNDLELKLKRFLDVEHLLYLNNGTIALQIAIKALKLSGEIVTTPFSYVATTSSIVWEGCTPVFVDIDPETLNIDPAKIEAAISPNTTAILATHVYGNPCDIAAIATIATEHGLKVIYDAAHCFATKYKGESVFKFGDISTTSFHATKLFHTVEGGAVFTHSPELLRKMSLLRNFGHTSAETFGDVGINGKNSELHAAVGLCNLQFIDTILESRRQQAKIYDEWFRDVNLRKPKVVADGESNFSYYPIILPDGQILEKLIRNLNDQWIYPRRYFFPSLSTLPYVNSPAKVPNAESICERVLCLPMYFGLTPEEQELVARIVLRTLRFK